MSSHIHNLLTTPAYFEITLFLISIVAGTLGAILGLGGGIIIIPTLTLLFGVNIRYAIGASIISVIATSSGAAATYVKDHITNIRVAMLLEVATSIGALTGAMLATLINGQFLFFLFGVVLLYSAIMMIRGNSDDREKPVSPDPWAVRLKLNSSYPDAALGKEVFYEVTHVVLGFFFMIGAGILSGLLGIGSGAMKVPAMDRAMGLPIKVSSATSNFMIGVTGAASAGAYFMRGMILPSLAAPVAIGVLVGSAIGTRLMVRLPNKQIRRAFVVVLFIIAIQMGLRGLGIGGQGE
jgi:uncharacterized membrane protein YfcA